MTLDPKWCWSIRPHAPHEYTAVIAGQSITLPCDGVTAVMVSPVPEPEEDNR